DQRLHLQIKNPRSASSEEKLVNFYSLMVSSRPVGRLDTAGCYSLWVAPFFMLMCIKEKG
ncbi:hypothetical protein, partial [uncultured Microscilla sp.]|uniref:hypothetical protein n=1 Tax=uncultured Microscilla sp. TaxID=432653 RepID=UPI002628EB25